MAGWSTDGDDGESPLARLALLEAENGIVQARRTASIIADAVGRSEPFVLTPQLICELNLLAVKGVVPTAGRLRVRSDLEISGSRHTLPPHEDVSRLLAEACNFVTQNWSEEATFLAAYVLWRICWIHPFDDGNGRCARATSYLVLSIRLGFELPGRLPIPARMKHAPRAYVLALEAADAAWQQGRLDVSALQVLIALYLQHQLDDAPPQLPP